MGWDSYKIWSTGNDKLIILAEAIRDQRTLQIIYEGGQTKTKMRPIRPMGIVRNPDGDYINAECGLDMQRKRFYIDKIMKWEFVT